MIKKKEIVNPNIKVDFLSIIFSSGFFTGYAPFASGTFGSAFALLFLLIPGFTNIFVFLPIILLCFLLGIYTSGKMTKRYGDDPSVVVIDEFVGMWITVFISGYISFGYLSVVIGFFMFRLFDIIKLYPASYFDKMKNGFGIMMDDVIAGIYGGAASVIILIILRYIM
ncbi:MAG: phosphatidylglycerophosphatase A [Ignavibacteria bacterium]